MANATAVKFGHPGSVVWESPHWLVQVRPQQPTLGALVLVCKEPAAAFSELSAEAFAGLRPAVAGVERVLRRFTAYEKINYLMLMMVDPDVHFHVLPRHAEPREWGGLSFVDAGWPGPPALGQAVALKGEALAAMVEELRALWGEANG